MAAYGHSRTFLRNHIGIEYTELPPNHSLERTWPQREGQVMCCSAGPLISQPLCAIECCHFKGDKVMMWWTIIGIVVLVLLGILLVGGVYFNGMARSPNPLPRGKR